MKAIPFKTTTKKLLRNKSDKEGLDKNLYKTLNMGQRD